MFNLTLDTPAGQERFRTITNSFYRGAHAVVVVFDMGDAQSLHAAGSFVNDAKRLSPPGSKIYLVGNKIDHFAQVITREVSEQYAASLGMDASAVHFTSAKTGKGIQELFEQVGEDLVEGYTRRLIEIQADTTRFKLVQPAAPVNQSEKKPKNCGDCVIL